VNALSAREAYRLWAPSYSDETALSFLESVVVDGLGVGTAGKRVADIGCGTGRRLPDVSDTLAVGVDLSAEMLAQAPSDQLWVCGDMRAVPLASEAFDVVWCRLAIGHLAELGTVYGELARICHAGGTIVVSDLSPAAAGAGHRRTFRDAGGLSHEVEHVVHSIGAHVTAASGARLALRARRDGLVGPSIRHFYENADRLGAYEAQTGTPLVLAFAWSKLGDARGAR
jgi:malonyl-CoA O-methyltransferase